MESTSWDSAEAVDPVILWKADSGTRRLVFAPNLHNNGNDQEACLSGDLRYQFKRKTDEFCDEASLSLASLHAGEWTKYKLPSGALLELYRVLDGLYALHAKNGVPRRRYLLVPIDDDNDQSAEAVSNVVEWLMGSSDKSALSAAITALQTEDARYLCAVSAAASLNALLVEWDQSTVRSEPDWHALLLRHEWVIEQVLGQPLVLFQDEATVSSETFRGKEGAYVDFMHRSPHTAAIALVEIKRADTDLMQKRAYRGDAYGPSVELVGAVAQAQYYRATFLRDSHTLLRKEKYLELAAPRSVVIAGDTRNLATDVEKSSFERYRAGVSDVQILTFDELRARIEGFLSIVLGEDSRT